MKKILFVVLMLYPFVFVFGQNKPQKLKNETKLERIKRRRPKMDIQAIKKFAKRENLKWQKQKKMVDSVAKKLKIPKKLKDRNGDPVYLDRIENGMPIYIGGD